MLRKITWTAIHIRIRKLHFISFANFEGFITDLEQVETLLEHFVTFNRTPVRKVYFFLDPDDPTSKQNSLQIALKSAKKRRGAILKRI